MKHDHWRRVCTFRVDQNSLFNSPNEQLFVKQEKEIVPTSKKHSQTFFSTHFATPTIGGVARGTTGPWPPPKFFGWLRYCYRYVHSTYSPLAFLTHGWFIVQRRQTALCILQWQKLHESASFRQPCVAIHDYL